MAGQGGPTGADCGLVPDAADVLVARASVASEPDRRRTLRRGCRVMLDAPSGAPFHRFSFPSIQEQHQ